MDNLTIVKVGGVIVNDSAIFESFLQQFAMINGRKILVHGGGKEATEVLNQLGIKSQFVKGRRITDQSTLKVITMVYAGRINKSVVSQLQAIGVNALGLSGADGNVLLSEKRVVGNVDFGFVGDIIQVNQHLIHNLIEQNIVPVFCPLTHNEHGQLLNTNADTIAAKVAESMSKQYNVSLRYCFEFNGVLSNKDDKSSIMPVLPISEFLSLQEKGIISDGMIPKVENAIQAKKNNVQEVIICGVQNLVSKQKLTEIYG